MYYIEMITEEQALGLLEKGFQIINMNEDGAAIGSYNIGDKNAIRIDNFVSGDKVKTPRGEFSVIDSVLKDILPTVGYGYHHSSECGLYDIVGNGHRAFAIWHLPA